MYVYFPKQNVLAVGDAVSGQGWPVVDWWSGGWIGGIVGGLKRLQTVADKDTRIVPARVRVSPWPISGHRPTCSARFTIA